MLNWAVKNNNKELEFRIKKIPTHESEGFKPLFIHQSCRQSFWLLIPEFFYGEELNKHA